MGTFNFVNENDKEEGDEKIEFTEFKMKIEELHFFFFLFSGFFNFIKIKKIIKNILATHLDLPLLC